MHQAMVDIIIDAIIGQYGSEARFCNDYIGIDINKWNEWKNGTVSLTSEEMRKTKALFSDYEWMLLQKVIRQTIIFPEKRNFALVEYKRVKAMIAKKWIQSGGGLVELISQKESYNKQTVRYANNSTINIKVSLKYDEWGFDDVLDFRLPAVVQKQIEDAPVDLLEWVNNNLADTYVQTESEHVNK